MNKILITTTIPLVFIALSGVANAMECRASAVEVLYDHCQKRDKGSKPRASCTATITASKNYFIFNDDVDYSTAASTHERIKPGKKRYKTIPYQHSVMQKYDFLKTAIFQSASITAYCYRGRNYFTIRTCYARATIKAKAYPHSCLKYKIQEILNDL